MERKYKTEVIYVYVQMIHFTGETDTTLQSKYVTIKIKKNRKTFLWMINNLWVELINNVQVPKKNVL